MIIDISFLHDVAVRQTGVAITVIATIYVACTLAISKLYVVQAYKFIKGENGAGDYCFATKIGQAMLRLAGILYAIFINDGTVFLVIALDFVGRWIEIASAHYALRRYRNMSRPSEPIVDAIAVTAST